MRRGWSQRQLCLRPRGPSERRWRVHLAWHSWQQGRPREPQIGLRGHFPSRPGGRRGSLGSWSRKRETLVLRLVELDNERFDHLPLTEDVILRHDLLISDKCSPQLSRHLLYAPKKRERGFYCKIFLESDRKNYNKTAFSFQLQGREDVES